MGVAEMAMKIKSVEAYWVHIPIPPERQHVSDFGKTLSFDGTIVRIDTECGITGWGEAKAQVGGMAQNQALTTLINEEFGRCSRARTRATSPGCGRCSTAVRAGTTR